MNLNQEQIDSYKKQCRNSFYGIVSFIDKLFYGEITTVKSTNKWIHIPTLFTLGGDSWRCQINDILVTFYIDKYCDADYYGFLMSDKIREYKLKKRISKYNT